MEFSNEKLVSFVTLTAKDIAVISGANIIVRLLERRGGVAPECLHIHNRNIYTSRTYINLCVEMYISREGSTASFTHRLVSCAWSQ